MSKPIQIFSEIEPLKRVMLHRPGAELENLMPDYLEDLLFDDIPFLAQAQQEHDFFAKVLVENGCEVVYLEDLAAETLQLSGCKEAFLDRRLQVSQQCGKMIIHLLLIRCQTFILQEIRLLL